jgi:hypothetical protein
VNGVSTQHNPTACSEVIAVGRKESSATFAEVTLCNGGSSSDLIWSGQVGLSLSLGEIKVQKPYWEARETQPESSVWKDGGSYIDARWREARNGGMAYSGACCCAPFATGGNGPVSQSVISHLMSEARRGLMRRLDGHMTRVCDDFVHVAVGNEA